MPDIQQQRNVNWYRESEDRPYEGEPLPEQPPDTEQEWTVAANRPNVLVSPDGKRFVIWAATDDDTTNAEHLRDKINAAVTTHEQAWVKVLNKIASEYARDMIVAKLELDVDALSKIKP